jgi:hypothetical protein
MASISRARRAAASAAVLLLACGPPKGIAPGAATAVNLPPPLPPRKLADVFLLEASGAQPDDTVLSVPSRAPRIVVLRRSAPDFGLFAELNFPERTLTGAGDAAVARLGVHPRPGLYGVDFALEGSLAEGATITFSYGAHFVAPAGARQRYGTDIAFERELAIGRVVGDTLMIFLPTSRPGSDMLSAPLPGPGRYLVAAPR